MVKITLISDLHGFTPQLPGGDLLIVAGDLTANDKLPQYSQFNHWLWEQDYRKKVFIAGNHDANLQKFLDGAEFCKTCECEYLQDSGTEFEGLNIWGSPWTYRFRGINPHCAAFTLRTDEELGEKWALIPDDIDILITHSPPFDILDRSNWIKRTGSQSLMQRLKTVQPAIHAFGHIHEAHGHGSVTWLEGATTLFFNCSHVNENYLPVNKPHEIELLK